MSSMVLWPGQTEPLDVERVGGKAHQLSRLVAWRQNVPAFFVIAADAFTTHLSDAGVNRTLQLVDTVEDAQLGDISAHLRLCIMSTPVSETLRKTLLAAYARLTETDAKKQVAVRSSALDEDSACASHAGMYETKLQVHGSQALIQALKSCWASAFEERCLVYRRAHGLSLSEAQVAVIVQRMAPTDCAGVAFSADPTTGARDRVVINAAFGCGEGVVQGSADTDVFHVERDGKVASFLTRKDRQVIAESEGTRTCEVPESLREAPVLDDAMTRQIAAVCRDIATRAGSPQDIEWAIGGRELFLLQTRPITALPPPPPTGKSRLWDNSNIVESYPGVTTPLTFSFARDAYTVVYRQFCEVMGVPAADIVRNRDIFPNMLGLVDGRLYYNLQSWYRIVSLLPGYSLNRTFLEQMMGVAEAAPESIDETSTTTGRLREHFRLLRTTATLIKRSATIDAQVEDFGALFGEVYSDASRMDFNAMSLDELHGWNRRLQERLLCNWKAPIVTDFFTMIFHGTLRKLCEKWFPDRPSLHNDLLTHQGGLASTEPAQRIAALAARIRANAEMRRAFEETPDAAVMDLCRRGGALHAIAGDVNAYLETFGDRYAEELKLETVDLRADPAPFFAFIRNHLDVPHLPSPRQGPDAEQEALDALRGSPLRRRVFRFVLHQARLHVRNRESMRLMRARIFGIARRIFTAAGQKLVEVGVLENARDVFFLTTDEIWAFVEGTGVTRSLHRLAEIRKEELVRNEAQRPSSRFWTVGAAHAVNAIVERRVRSDNGGALCGLGACAGRVQGAIRVVSNPNGVVLQPGEIIAAERTDPAWVPLFARSAGLLVERGSLLSHSAIVARELGIPTIVGIEGLLQTVSSGDHVMMDGSTGTVTMVTQQQAARGGA